MEFENYEFESLQCLSDSDTEIQVALPTTESIPEPQLQQHEFSSDQTVVTSIPISLIMNGLIEMDS